MLFHIADGVNKKTPQHNLIFWCSNHVKDMIKSKLMQPRRKKRKGVKAQWRNVLKG
jgi:hypothetical protein